MVAQDHPLPVARRCELLGLPRSTLYYEMQSESAEELRLMKLIDQCHLDHPFYGSRRIRDWLEDHGEQVNRKRIQRLMRKMGLCALYPK
jgi:putative transposase